MQKIITVALFFLFVSIHLIGQKSSDYKSPINWLTLEEADSLYKIQKRPIFIDVFTNWCGWCKRMDASTFKDPTVAAYLNTNFYPVKLNAETRDTITFNGKTYTNSQSSKAKEIINNLNEKITFLTDSINKLYLSKTESEKAKKDGKKILVHLINKNSISSNIMDKASYRDPFTAKKINANFHAVKLNVNEINPIKYRDQVLKNVNGVHQLSIALMQNKISFPTHSFLDNNGNLIMRVPQFFAPKLIDPVLD